MITKIDHIGIAVKSLENSVALYENALGFKCEKIEVVESQKVKTAFFDIGGVHIELLEPTSEESPIYKFLEKNGEGIHHLAFESTEIGEDLNKAKAGGVRLINEVPFTGAGGKQVAFLHPKSMGGVLTELCSGH